MDKRYYLAIDIGASSGRHMLSHMENGKIVLEEIYRFPNGMEIKNGHKVWDVERLFKEILTGMKVCKSLGKIPYSLGIDTWAVDFVLLDEKNCMLGDAVAYRDNRTDGIDKKVYEVIAENELYKRNGIQKQLFNTIYQLMAIKEQRPELLEYSQSMLMIPDYFHFLLTGKKVQEYTNATTTQLVDPETKEWDFELIDKLELPRRIFQSIQQPGYSLGGLDESVQAEVGFNCEVVLPPTHDTASAVVAVPAQDENTLYISSGTWSLVGTELHKANCSNRSMVHNFTNEGGYDYRFRYLKNIMGLWMIQSVRNEIAPDMSYGEICELASKGQITSIINANDERFLAPDSMVEEIRKACFESGQQVPQNIAELAAVIYRSLAKCYADTVKELELLTRKQFPCINIVGGGSKAEYLNRLTAKETKRKVYAGPAEATAIGNIVVQMIAGGECCNLRDARRRIADAFPITQYEFC